MIIDLYEMKTSGLSYFVVRHFIVEQKGERVSHTENFSG